MARQFFVVCDGCDKRTATDAPDGVPKGGTFLKCVVSINGDQREPLDLCQRCFDQLLRDSDPKRWTRGAEMVPGIYEASTIA